MMEISKIQQIFALEWLQLQADLAKMFALVPRGEKDNANSHGYIMEMKGGVWRCAALDASGEMCELGIVPRRIDARQAVQKAVIAARRELDSISEKAELIYGEDAPHLQVEDGK